MAQRVLQQCLKKQGKEGETGVLDMLSPILEQIGPLRIWRGNRLLLAGPLGSQLWLARLSKAGFHAMLHHLRRLIK
jgi:hypothetical protein